MKITMEGKYQTRDGRAVRILATDLKLRDYPVIGAITEADGTEEPCEWMVNGQALDCVMGDSSLDLVPIPTKHHGYVVVGLVIVHGGSHAVLNAEVYRMHQQAEDHRLRTTVPEMWIVVPLDWKS